MLKVLDRDQLNDSIAVVVGTRPGIVKMSPVIRALTSDGGPFFVVHTGQHYSENMDQQFFDDLDLPQPQYKVESTRDFATHAGQTAEMMKGVESALMDRRPWVTIVGGDANTNLAGALAARKLGIAVAHVEAGLRSLDWRMPEEHNRVMIDHISDYLFPPTEGARANLLKDAVRGKITVVGNTVVDAIKKHAQLAESRSQVLEKLGIGRRGYVLVTTHREENVDSEKVLRDILDGLGRVAEIATLPLVFPVHPRTRQRLKQFGLDEFAHAVPGMRVIEPVGYLDFVCLLSGARLVLSDSGGVQEEACVLHVPCVTIRENTERPETLEVGANLLAGTDPERMARQAAAMLEVRPDWGNPFGDGRAGERIAQTLRRDNGAFHP